MNAIFPLGRGDAFSFFAAWLPEFGAPATLELVTITSQVRTMAGVLVADVAITQASDFLGFSGLVQDTTAWPLENLEWDIKCVIGSMPVHSQTILIAVGKTVTA